MDELMFFLLNFFEVERRDRIRKHDRCEHSLLLAINHNQLGHVLEIRDHEGKRLCAFIIDQMFRGHAAFDEVLGAIQHHQNVGFQIELLHTLLSELQEGAVVATDGRAMFEPAKFIAFFKRDIA
jgi:hypothetical protein